MRDTMRMYAAFASMAAMDMINTKRSHEVPQKPTEIVKSSDYPVVPKGCKEYLFNSDGKHCYETHVDREQIAFKCFALNDKSAVKKFNKFKADNPNLLTPNEKI